MDAYKVTELLVTLVEHPQKASQSSLRLVERWSSRKFKQAASSVELVCREKVFRSKELFAEDFRSFSCFFNLRSHASS